MLSLAAAKVFSRPLFAADTDFAFLNRNAVLVAFQFFQHSQIVLSMPRRGAFSHVALAQQRLCARFPSGFFYTQDTCSLEFGTAFGTSTS